MHLKTADFNQMLFNVTKFDPKKPITLLVPELKIFSSYEDAIEKETNLPFNLVMRYIILMYDKNTPLSMIEKYQLRKTKAAEYAGFETITKNKQETFEPSVIKLISTPCEYVSVNRVSVLFLRFHRSQKYSALATYNEMFYGTIEKIYSGEYDKGKKELIDTLKDDIEEAYFDLFQTQTIDEALKEEAEMVILEDAVGLNPEDITTRLQEGRYFCLLNGASSRK